MRIDVSKSFTAVFERVDIDLQYDWHEWNEWLGDYSFNEYAPHNQNMLYSISITKRPKWSVMTAQVEINGFQTETKCGAWVFGNANYLEIVYSSYLTEQMDASSPHPLVRNGQIMLAFSRKDDALVTTWGKLEPMLPENKVPGIYFTNIENYP